MKCFFNKTDKILNKGVFTMKYLIKPLKVGTLELKNRLVMPSMATAKSEGDGKVSQQVIDYYKEKSDGGYISLIIIEHSFICKEGKASKGQLSISDDSNLIVCKISIAVFLYFFLDFIPSLLKLSIILFKIRIIQSSPLKISQTSLGKY
jgi:hypothetical protein